MAVHYGNPPLLVEIEREAFSDIWTVKAEGQTLDFWIEDLRQWLLTRNADEYELEKALDEAYHFRRVVMVISNPRVIKGPDSVDDPKI